MIGIFEDKGRIKTAVIRLKEAGFGENDLALVTKYEAEEVRDVLGDEPEQTAATGAIVGSGIGGTLGLIGGLTLVPMTGMGLLAAYGFLGTLSGGTLGSYLGSLYATRLNDQPEHELKTALADDKLVLLVRVKAVNQENARVIMQQAGGSYLEIHDINPEVIPELAG